VHKRPYRPAYQIEPATETVDIEHVTTMFTMYAAWDAVSGCENLGVEGAVISGVYYSRLEIPQNSTQAAIARPVFTRPLSELNDLGIASQPASEISRVLKAQNGVLELVFRRAIYQIDESVLQPAGFKSVNDMKNEGTGVTSPGSVRKSRHMAAG
jgi:hypothetical protein